MNGIAAQSVRRASPETK